MFANITNALDLIARQNPAIVNSQIPAHISVNGRLYIVGQTNNGKFATWQIGAEGASNNGHYDFVNVSDAIDDMLERARG